MISEEIAWKISNKPPEEHQNGDILEDRINKYGVWIKTTIGYAWCASVVENIDDVWTGRSFTPSENTTSNALISPQQMGFLLKFFTNEQYPGWQNIAKDLITTGYCIVPGDECIYKGGIGNFITTEPADIAFGCLLYKFDIKLFLKSEWYKLASADAITEIEKQILDIETEKESLSEYMHYIRKLA